jgi:hypothetical protein
VPKAMTTISGIRPSGLTGAPAPRPLAQWIEHLKRTRLAAKKARGVHRQRHAATQARLREVEKLLGEIIASGDVIAQGAQENSWGNGEPVVFVLLTMHTASFNNLAIFGSELEDLEDSHDAEPDRLTGEIEFDECDNEASIASGAVMPAGMAECEEPSYPFGAKDQAIIKAARERYKKPPEPERCGVLTYATVDPETKRAGAWVLQRKRGAK